MSVFVVVRFDGSDTLERNERSHGRVSQQEKGVNVPATFRTAIVGLLACGAAHAFDPNLRYAFVTSTSGSGNLQSWGTDAGGQVGLQAGDAICQARAAAGG